ncbi:MAG TPA: hypothetical protein VH744_06060, partial [Terriglobales bacterium]
PVFSFMKVSLRPNGKDKVSYVIEYATKIKLLKNWGLDPKIDFHRDGISLSGQRVTTKVPRGECSKPAHGGTIKLSFVFI